MSLSARKTGHMKSIHAKRKLLDDSDSDSDGGAEVGAEAEAFKVNEEYARRFEHNKKREERHKLEEKYKRDGDDDSSSNETEDEDGFLATEDLDAQISATLEAIRTKDPRVYDKNVTFVQLPDEEGPSTSKEKKEKPVFLRDYQREKILRGDIGESDGEDEAPQTYVEEQDALKKSIMSEIRAARDDEESDSGSDDDGFMKRKEPQAPGADGLHPSRSTRLRPSELDVAGADKNPDSFLSNFMAARAWIPEEGTKWKTFESDEGEEDEAADDWEHAYNMRFEDPDKSNQVLRSYARDFTAARSVRRHEKTSRQRQREAEREQREEKERGKREEKARLRKLKLEESEEKLRKVKQAAGAVGKELREEEWMQFLDDAWDNDRWVEAMQKRFGDEYYAMSDEEAAASDGEAAATPDDKKSRRSKKGPKKPKWDDDIDINDIVPDFEADDEARPPIALSDGEDAAAGQQAADADADAEHQRPSKKRKATSDKRSRLDAKRAARQERARLEALVDSKLELTHHALLAQPPTTTSSPSTAAAPGAAGATPFRYRETSPQAFGLTPRDILLAPSDRALNAFAGLKKLAPFRDADRKRRDRKRLARRARLRQWRRDVFGPGAEAAGPELSLEQAVAAADAAAAADSKDNKDKDDGKGNGRHVQTPAGRKKKRRRSVSRAETAAEAA